MSGQSQISYIDDVNNSLELTSTELHAGKTDLTFFAHRDFYGWDRASLASLSGVVANPFTNQSSVVTDNPDTASYSGGALLTGPTSPSTRLLEDHDNDYVAWLINGVGSIWPTGIV